MTLYNVDYHLRSAFDNALKLVESGEQAVLAYYEIAGEANGYAAVTYGRNVVQTIGGILDYVESIFRRRGATLDYHDLARFAQDPRGFLDEVKMSIAKGSDASEDS
jgi:hypothetical protein